jgi:hypothetical protein
MCQVSVSKSVCTNLSSNIEFHMNTNPKLKTHHAFLLINVDTWKSNHLGWLGFAINTTRTRTDGFFDVFLWKTDLNNWRGDRRVFYTRMDPNNIEIGNVTILPRQMTSRNHYYGFKEVPVPVEMNQTMQVIVMRNYDQNIKLSTHFEKPQMVLYGTMDPSGSSKTYRCQNAQLYNVTLSFTQYYQKFANTHRLARGFESLVFISLQIVCLIFIISLRKKSILIRSRFITPLSSIFVEFLSNALALVECILFISKHWNIGNVDGTIMLTWSLLGEATAGAMKSAAYATITVVYAVSVIRYFIIRNLNKLIRKQNKVFKLNANRTFKFYKIAGSRWVMYLLTIILVSGNITILILAARSDKIVYTLFEQVDAYFALAPMYLFLLIGVIALSGLLLDAISNRRIIWNNGRPLSGIIKYFKSDPLVIRLELLLCGISILLQSTMIIPSHIAVHRISKNTTVILILYFLPSLLISPLFFYGLFPCIIELYRRVKLRYNKQKNNTLTQVDTIESVLTDPDSLRLMKDYAAQEFSSENIALWELLWKYKIRGVMKLKKAQKIYDLFISNSSTMEVNVPAKTKKNYNQLLKDNRLLDENEMIPFDSFSALYRDVLANITETFTRFSTTAEYKAKEIENYLLVNEYMMDNTVLASSYIPLVNEK